MLQMFLFLLDDGDVGGRETFGALLNVELYFVPFIQGFVAACRDRIEVDENIFAAFARNETETFCCVEPFDCSFFHGTRPFVYVRRPGSTAGQGVRHFAFLNDGGATLEGLVRFISRTTQAVYCYLTVEDGQIPDQFLINSDFFFRRRKAPLSGCFGCL